MTRDCGACFGRRGIERRDFLRDAAAAALAAAGLSFIPGVVYASTEGIRRGTEKTYAIPAADTVAIDRDESVIIAHFAGRVYAFSLACPHQNTALRWEAEHRRFQCPKHHSRYQPDGTFIEGRATRGLDRFAVRRDGVQVSVNLDALYRQDENAAEWAAAFVEAA